MNLNGKRLLLLGGTNSIEEIRKYADDNGIILVAAGNIPNTQLKQISNEAYDVDALDEEKMTALVKEKNIDGIFVGCNEAVIPCAVDIAEKCGLPRYCTHEQWDLCANKAKFKEMCRKSGIPVSFDYYIDDIESIVYPVAVKPADSCGSKGFSVCYSENELSDAVEKALNFSAAKHILIEEYMPYDAVIIHYTLINGDIFFSGMSDKISMKLKDYGSSVMALQVFPSEYTESYVNSLDNKVRKMFKDIGVHDGAIWIEAFNNNGKFSFNEMGYRFGGSMTYYPIRYFYGIDQLELMMRYALEGKIKEDIKYSLIDRAYPSGKKYSILPLHLNPGTIDKISGKEDVCSMENVYAFVQIHHEGDQIEKTGTVNQVFCYLHVLFDDMRDLKNTLKKIISALNVTDKENHEMMFCLFDIDKMN